MTKLILMCRLRDRQEWDQIANPLDSDFLHARLILSNTFNEYVEWLNCGVIYRVIRAKDLDMYLEIAALGEADWQMANRVARE